MLFTEREISLFCVALFLSFFEKTPGTQECLGNSRLVRTADLVNKPHLNWQQSQRQDDHVHHSFLGHQPWLFCPLPVKAGNCLERSMLKYVKGLILLSRAQGYSLQRTQFLLLKTWPMDWQCQTHPGAYWEYSISSTAVCFSPYSYVRPRTFKFVKHMCKRHF